MKSCELCKSAATMYCESDQASLCWNCDAKVHSANFLVARHSRNLLCHLCQSPTPWNASGAKLGHTVSVCESCVDRGERAKEDYGGEGDEESDGGYDGEDDNCGDDAVEDDDDEDLVEEDDEVSGDDEDGDNQVVPWSSSPPPPSPPPPPPAASSSSGEDSSSRFRNGGVAVSLKQLRDSAAVLCSDDDHGCSSSRRKDISPSAAICRETALVDSLRPLKRQRTEPARSVFSSSRDAAIVESLQRFPERYLKSGNDVSAAVVEICDLSKNHGAVRPDSSECRSRAI